MQPVCLYLCYYAPIPRVRALSDDTRLTSVCLTSICLSRTSGLSREERGLGRLKIGTEVDHVTRDSDTPLLRSKGQRSTCRGGAYCGGLSHSLFRVSSSCCRFYCKYTRLIGMPKARSTLPRSHISVVKRMLFAVFCKVFVFASVFNTFAVD